MKHMTQKQLARLSALYDNGQLDGQSLGDWTTLSEEDGIRFITEAENVSTGTFSPASETLKTPLRDLIRAGKLILREELLRFMMRPQAAELIWMIQSTDKNTEPDITHAQCRRIKVLMAKGFLKYLPSCEIKCLSFKKAQDLIAEGEDNALKER